MSFEAVFATFGGASNIWLENEHWLVLVRPQQVTLGASVLMPRRSVLLLGGLYDREFITFGSACREMERRLHHRFNFDKVNYLMLGMRDPLLHFHVIPRYSAERQFAQRTWIDSAWPKPPDLTVFVDDASAVASVRDILRSE